MVQWTKTLWLDRVWANSLGTSHTGTVAHHKAGERLEEVEGEGGVEGPPGDPVDHRHLHNAQRQVHIPGWHSAILEPTPQREERKWRLGTSTMITGKGQFQLHVGRYRDNIKPLAVTVFIQTFSYVSLRLKFCVLTLHWETCHILHWDLVRRIFVRFNI